MSDMDSAMSISLTCKENVNEEMLQQFLGFIKGAVEAIELQGEDSPVTGVIRML
jgi:hypothetical protein